jgi:hypothetical protein
MKIFKKIKEFFMRKFTIPVNGLLREESERQMRDIDIHELMDQAKMMYSKNKSL